MSLARTTSYGNEDNQWITISPRPWTQSIMLMYVNNFDNFNNDNISDNILVICYWLLCSTMFSLQD